MKLVNLFFYSALEGEQVKGVAVIEFPAVEMARSGYDSPAYSAIKHHRINGEYIGLLVEGGAQ